MKDEMNEPQKVFGSRDGVGARRVSALWWHRSCPVPAPRTRLGSRRTAPRDVHVSISVAFSAVQVHKSKPVRRTALTLAALEDSGWYKANYSMAEPFEWGRGRGCDFAAALQYKRCLRDLRSGRSSHCDL